MPFRMTDLLQSASPGGLCVQCIADRMRTLRENQRVSYDLQQDNRGKLSAANLKNAEEATETNANQTPPADDEQQAEAASDHEAK